MLRRRQIVPRLAGVHGGARFRQLATHGLRAQWILADGSALTLLANLGEDAICLPATEMVCPEPLYALPAGLDCNGTDLVLHPWSVIWFLGPPAA
jgi:hypothetical protein